MYRIMPKSPSTLTTTIVGEWIIADEERDDVDLEMRLFQCAVRTAFNRLLEGMDKGDVEKIVYSMFNINSRYAKDAVMQARSIQSSQRELLKQHKEEKERAIRGLRKKLDSISNEDKRESISTKLEQLTCEVANLEGHIENSTIPKVIFGGRENFELRRSGKLSNADWKNLRNNKLYSRGDKSKEGGNLNTKIEIVEDGFSLSVAISHKRPIEARSLPQATGSKTAPRVTGKLWIDVRLKERMREHLEDGSIYSIELIRGIDNKYRVHITFDVARSCEERSKAISPFKVVSFLNGAIGVDANPDGIALTEISTSGNLISSMFYALPELTYSSTNRRLNLIGVILRKLRTKEIVSIANSLGKGLVIESLNFVKKNKGKQFNRMSHNFVYRRLLESIERRCRKCGVAIKQVNPAYHKTLRRWCFTHR